jgi:hypothetical protein
VRAALPGNDQPADRDGEQARLPVHKVRELMMAQWPFREGMCRHMMWITML